MRLVMSSKKHHLQLYADECFPYTTVTYLRSKGISVVHALDRRTLKKNDEYHLKESKKLKKILITLDRDFLYYEQINLNHNPGVIVISVSSAISLNINSVCDKLFPKIKPELVKGSIIKATIDKMTKIKDGKIIFEKDL